MFILIEIVSFSIICCECRFNFINIPVEITPSTSINIINLEWLVGCCAWDKLWRHICINRQIVSHIILCLSIRCVINYNTWIKSQQITSRRVIFSSGSVYMVKVSDPFLLFRINDLITIYNYLNQVSAHHKLLLLQ